MLKQVSLRHLSYCQFSLSPFPPFPLLSVSVSASVGRTCCHYCFCWLLDSRWQRSWTRKAARHFTTAFQETSFPPFCKNMTFPEQRTPIRKETLSHRTITHQRRQRCNREDRTTQCSFFPEFRQKNAPKGQDRILRTIFVIYTLSLVPDVIAKLEKDGCTMSFVKRW